MTDYSSELPYDFELSLPRKKKKVIHLVNKFDVKNNFLIKKQLKLALKKLYISHQNIKKDLMRYIITN